MSDLRQLVNAAFLKVGQDIKTLKADLAAGSGGASDPEIKAIAGLTSAADRIPYFTGVGTAALAGFTSFGRSLVASGSSDAVRQNIDVYGRSQVDGLINAHADQSSQFGKELGYGERTSNFATTNQTFQSGTAGVIPALSCQFTGDGGIVEIECNISASSTVANTHWAAWFVVNGSASPPGGFLAAGALVLANRTATLPMKRRFQTSSGTSYTITVGVGVVTASTLTVAGNSTTPMWIQATKR